MSKKRLKQHFISLFSLSSKDLPFEKENSKNFHITKFFIKHPFIHFIKLHKKNFALGLITLLFTNGFDIAGPYLIGKTIDLLATRTQEGFWFYIALLVVVSIGTALFRYLWRIYFSRFHQQVAADLRNILFKKLMALRISYHQKVPTGEKMTLLTQDIDNFRMGIGPGILILCDSLIYTLGLLPLMIMISLSWTWKCLILMPLIPFLTYLLEKSFTKRYRDYQDTTGELTSFAQETVSGIKVIKSLSLHNFRSYIFNPINRKLKDYGLKVDFIEAIFGPVLELFVMIGTATLLFVGSIDVINGNISIGDFFAFYQYLLRMIWPMTAFGISFMMYKEATSSFERITQTLVSEEETPTGKVQTQKGLALNVDQLSFYYPDQDTPTLKDLSFELQPNESMAIVGPVGSGKSTLAQILARSILPQDSAVFYGETPIEKIQKNIYSKMINLVPQDVFLFKDTIGNNLTNFTSESSKTTQALDNVHKALQSVELKEEVLHLSQGLDTPLLEKGGGLSGGQRQRLTLARGLLQSPQWLILDDSLSAVDISTEQKIMSHLQSYKAKGMMNFIICSHRIQNIKWVDKILVLKHGKADAIGTHEQLLQQCSLYKNLYTSSKKVMTNDKDLTS